jgi:hypothetical protein
VQPQGRKREVEMAVLEGHRFDSCITTNIADGVREEGAIGFMPRKHFLSILHSIPGGWLHLRNRLHQSIVTQDVTPDL